MEYRIDDLARAAGTTVRTVRAYQERGLLPPPRLAGRVGYYDEAHLARLRLIAQLLEQGFSLQLIGRVLRDWQGGRNLADVLGLEAALVAPWSDETAEPVSAERLVELFGPEALHLAGRAVQLGLLEPDGEGFRAPSPRLLAAGAELVAAGIPLPAVLDLSEALVQDVEQIARRLIDAVSAHLVPDRPGWAENDEQLRELAAVIRRLRPLAAVAVEAELARAMQRVVREQLGERLLGGDAAPGPAQAS